MDLSLSLKLLELYHGSLPQLVVTFIACEAHRKLHLGECPLNPIFLTFQLSGSIIWVVHCILGARIYYSYSVDKVIQKTSGWHSRILSYEGKETLIKHVLLSILIHTLFAMSPPKTTLKYIKNAIADFFFRAGIRIEGSTIGLLGRHLLIL